MGLKLSNFLFTGPFNIEETIVRGNQNPVVFAIISKEGEPWNPSFRLLDVGVSDLEGVRFSTHTDRPMWETEANGDIGIYLLDFPRKDPDLLEKRIKVVATLKSMFNPPNGTIPLQGNM